MDTYTPPYVYNAIQTPDGTVIESRHRHDYVTYEDANGKQYMVDGGLEYLRRNHQPEHPYRELSVRSDAPFEQIRKVFAWGSYGKDGKQPLRWVRLCDMSDQHLKAVMDHVSERFDWTTKLFATEISFRHNHEIVITEPNSKISNNNDKYV